MKAIRVREFGAPEVLRLEEVDDLKPGKGEILVRVKAIGINPVDTYIRAGVHARKPDLPYTPGMDAAGVVESVGENVENFKAGDRVWLAGTSTGAYAEFCLAEEKDAFPLPENVSFEQGAGVFVPYATAYRGLVQRAEAKAGETVLIHGASGGVGIAAVQIAKKTGLKVIGTGGSEEGRKLILDEGADFALDHTAENYLEEIKKITDGHGVDIVLEMLANVNLQKDLEMIATFGRIVVIGNRGTIEINPRTGMTKEATIHTMSLFNAPPEKMREIQTAINEGLADGSLRPIVGKTFSLEEAAAAHREVLESKAFGKIVLVT